MQQPACGVVIVEVEKGLAEVLHSKHVPHHLLCKSHTCERLDSDILSALTEKENKIGLKKLIISQEPSLKSFLGSAKCVTEVELVSILKLVSRDSDGKTVSFRDQFDLALECDDIHKSLSLYKEKRFTKLGYLAGAVFDCLPYFRKILVETPLKNLLVRACRIYVDNKFIAAGLKALAIFTFKVTMPFLNFVEKSIQEDLVKVLPQLFVDLSAANFKQ